MHLFPSVDSLKRFLVVHARVVTLPFNLNKLILLERPKACVILAYCVLGKLCVDVVLIKAQLVLVIESLQDLLLVEDGCY